MASQKPTTLAGQIDRVRHYLEEGPVEGAAARPEIHKLQVLGRFCYLVGRRFVETRCALRAAALSYTTLLALIPLLAVVLSVSKNFLHDTSANLVPRLLDKLVSSVAPQLEYMPESGRAVAGGAGGQVVVSSRARQEAVEKIQSFIGNINAGALGTVGTILLIVIAIRLMMTIEESFNDIWGVTRGRSIWQKIVYYWATITLGPLLLLLAAALTGTLEFSSLVGKLRSVPGFEKLLLHLTPFVLLWIGFALMYALMPNTRVRLQAAVIGGIAGGTLWQLNNLLSTLYVSRVVAYSKIYGSLGIIPVLLLGLYFAWLIVLVGAQVSFVAQNIGSYLQQRASQKVDQEGRELIACRVVLLACLHFLQGRPPPTLEDVAARLGVPSPLLAQLVRRLVEGRVLSETGDEARALQPARPPGQITIADVLHVVRTHTGTYGDTAVSPGGDTAGNSLRALYEAERAAPANSRFSDLVARLNNPI